MTINQDQLRALLQGDQAHADAIAPGVADGETSPLSFQQQRLWFLQRYEPASTAYNVCRAFRLEGPCDGAALETALRALVQRHGVLRTQFEEHEGVPLQRMVADPQLVLMRERAPDRGTADWLAARLQREADTPFNLAQAPLLRAVLIDCGARVSVLMLSMHHIVSDAWSNPVLIRDLAQAYRNAQAGAPGLPPLALQYADYARWQRSTLQGARLETELAYWRAYLGDAVPALNLPALNQPALNLPARSQPTAPGADAVATAPCAAAASPAGALDNRAGHHDVALPPALAAAAQAFCRVEHCTPFVLLMAAWQLVLARLSGQRDFAIGVPNAGRNRHEVHDLIGFFVNTQVYRVRLAPGLTARSLCRRLRGEALAALEHAELPFELLLDAMRVERDLSRSPLFQVLFNMRHDDGAAPVLPVLDGLAVSLVSEAQVEAKFDLSLDIAVGAAGVTASFEYRTALFDAPAVAAIGAYFIDVLATMLAQPDTVLDGLDLMSPAHTAALLATGCNPGGPWNDLPVHLQFAAQAARHPDAVALIDGEAQLTYRTLNLRANRLAHALIARGAAPEVRIGIAVERSIDMIVGLLAILKTGAAYVPLDPGYPAERLAHMIADSGMTLLLTQGAVLPLLPALPQTVAVQLVEQPSAREHDPAVQTLGQQLAYVIYTSGSTGKPKGVGIAHQALSRHVQVSVGFFGLTAQDRMLQFSTLNFDGFVEQTWPTLCVGATLVLRGPDLWDSETFYQALQRHRITVADLTTAYWSLLAQDFAGRGPRDYGVLRQVHAGGEAMPPEALQAWRQAGMTYIRLLNTYGPTEATVTATTLDCAPYIGPALPRILARPGSLQDLQAPEAAAAATVEGVAAEATGATGVGAAVASGAEAGAAETENAAAARSATTPSQMPIGTPLPGRALQVVDAGLALAPGGAAGELCIGGALLARGYLGRPGLTAERFVPDPHGVPGARRYRTGDLVRWRDGQLDYLGRIDHQVKIRGFRVELGEIEAQLLAQPGVREAVVVAQQGSAGLQLVAYISPQREDAQVAELRQALAATLPDYMQPAAIVALARLPLSPAGKVERSALPALSPRDQVDHSDSAYVTPQGELEQALAAIWCALLDVPRVGRDDNFFALGGHSLLAVQLVSRVNLQLSVALPLRAVFETRSLALMAAHIATLRPPSSQPSQQSRMEDLASFMDTLESL
ncbi:hypothetical protein ASF61_07035 [Duganella sp. Leaf126]|uniref:condensation domain-containing protein n=1 Tax=Duganella sp. Leaf126 TaxID=1736266 RepID=UPI0006F6487D|nr:condensation domain-containing protein [Duganella sp. Leaf126]KQQ35967.1 hypothetical protein ASF61_07035 [Duganella sp. Leaf126]